MTTLKVSVGDRVRLRRGVDRYPDFIAHAGLLGTVTCTEEDGKPRVRVLMDLHVPGCEEWDNEVEWADYNDSLDEIEGDLEVLA